VTRGTCSGAITTLTSAIIGLVTWETVVVIHKGANYGYPLREGTQSMSSTNGMGALPEDDMIPIQISDVVARGTVKPTYPVIQYPHSREAGGDAIANGFVYRGRLIPALKDKLVFGDITTGRITATSSAVIKRGLPPPMMAGFDGRIPDHDIWSIVNYLRTIAPRK
jgi:hypothetical protein